MTKRQMRAEIISLRERIASLEGELAIAKSMTWSNMIVPSMTYTTGAAPGSTWYYQFPSGGSV